MGAGARRKHLLIRVGESNSTQPMLAGEARVVQIYRPAALGGELSLDWQLDVLRRASDSERDGADADTVADGRDRVRASLIADWRRNWVLPGGVLAATQAELALDAVRVAQDPSFDAATLRALPSAGLRLSWPLVRAGIRTTQVTEPAAQLVWSRDDLDEVLQRGQPAGRISTRATCFLLAPAGVGCARTRDAGASGVELDAGCQRRLEFGRGRGPGDPHRGSGPVLRGFGTVGAALRLAVDDASQSGNGAVAVEPGAVRRSASR